MYVVSLVGTHVYQNNTIVCVIPRMSSLDKVRHYIKQKFGVEFENLSATWTSSWWRFENTTDDRDIALVVERVYTEDDIDAFLS